MKFQGRPNDAVLYIIEMAIKTGEIGTRFQHWQELAVDITLAWTSEQYKKLTLHYNKTTESVRTYVIQCQEHMSTFYVIG